MDEAYQLLLDYNEEIKELMSQNHISATGAKMYRAISKHFLPISRSQEGQLIDLILKEEHA